MGPFPNRGITVAHGGIDYRNLPGCERKPTASRKSCIDITQLATALEQAGIEEVCLEPPVESTPQILSTLK